MLPTMIDASALKLTTDDRGVVWHLKGEGLPHSSGMHVDEFLGTDTIRAINHVRIVGSTYNARLLTNLWKIRTKERLNSLLVEVGSPLSCDDAEDRKDPELVLHRMRHLGNVPSLGGWHKFDERDFVPYALSSYYQEGRDHDQFTQRLTRVHPAWASLSFIEGIDVDACGLLMALILDPRWYIDLHDPNRGSKLEQFLGLTPKTQASAGTSEPSGKDQRCRLVMSCWKTPGTMASGSPGEFLWRIYTDKGGGSKGDLAASKAFISYFRLTWLNSMVTDGHIGRLFVPKYFFKNEETTARAYMDHVQKTVNRS